MLKEIRCKTGFLNETADNPEEASDLTSSESNPKETKRDRVARHYEETSKNLSEFTELLTDSAKSKKGSQDDDERLVEFAKIEKADNNIKKIEEDNFWSPCKG